ncbi:MAG: TMEM165/GDT1 family protein [Thalassolituus sp.]
MFDLLNLSNIIDASSSSSVLSSPLLASTLAVSIAEIGDKTQLLSLLLVTRFRNRWAIVAGILLATLINHGLSAWGGDWLGDRLQVWLASDSVNWLLAASFAVMAIWVLIPDKEGDDTASYSHWGAFGATTVLFFLAEIGDKTQIATVLLAAEFQDVLWVTVGTTLGMMIANVPVVVWGQALMQRMPLDIARYATSFIFFVLALWALMS